MLLSLAVGLLMNGGRWAAYSSVTAVLLTPWIWPAATSPRNRTAIRGGAAGGAWVAFLAQMIPPIIGALWFRIIRTIVGPGGGLAAMIDLVGLIFFFLSGCIAALIGAGVGAVLERRGRT